MVRGDKDRKEVRREQLMSVEGFGDVAKECGGVGMKKNRTHREGGVREYRDRLFKGENIS